MSGKKNTLRSYFVLVTQHSRLEPRKSTANQRKSNNIELLATDLAIENQKCVQQKHGTNHSINFIHQVDRKKLLDTTQQSVWNELLQRFFSEPNTRQNTQGVFVCIEEIESQVNNNLRFVQLV